jgi:hypothetical protein
VMRMERRVARRVQTTVEGDGRVFVWGVSIGLERLKDGGMDGRRTFDFDGRSVAAGLHDAAEEDGDVAGWVGVG